MRLFLVCLIIFFALALVGCAGASPTAPATASDQAQASPTTTEAPTIAPTKLVTQAPTSTSEEAGVDLTAAIEGEQDYCLECHTDQQRLIDTAKPEEEVVKESEGAG